LSKDYSNKYSDDSFWKKVGNYALKAGKQVIETALTLYFCLGDPDTPAWAKGVIIGALGYFIFPLDAIPDIIPGAGYTDDLGVLSSALLAVAVHIKDEHKQKAQEKLKQWFG